MKPYQFLGGKPKAFHKRPFYYGPYQLWRDEKTTNQILEQKWYAFSGVEDGVGLAK